MTWNPMERPYLWKHLIATEQIATIPCILHTVTINHPDAVAGTITLYDVADAGDIDATNMIANITTDSDLFVVPVTMEYDVGCENGLYILFSAGLTTADITVSYI